MDGADSPFMCLLILQIRAINADRPMEKCASNDDVIEKSGNLI
jgi:hypothetical protein